MGTARPRVRDSWQIGLPFDARRVEELDICAGCGWAVALHSFIPSFIQVFIKHLLNARRCAWHRKSIIPALVERTVSWGSTGETGWRGRNEKSQRRGLHRPFPGKERSRDGRRCGKPPDSPRHLVTIGYGLECVLPKRYDEAPAHLPSRCDLIWK